MPATFDTSQPRRKRVRTDQNDSDDDDYRSLLQDRKSKLTKVNELSNKLNESVLQWLPENDYLELCELLPPIDLYFIRRPNETNSDDGLDDDDDRPLEEVVEEYPKTVEDAIRMKNDPRYVPCINPQIFKEPAFKETVEDWQVLLAEGMFEPSDDETDEQTIPAAPAKQSSRKRSRNQVEDDDWKVNWDFVCPLSINAWTKRALLLFTLEQDDNFEAYWGERLQKQKKGS